MTWSLNLKKTRFFARWRQHSKTTYIIQIQISPLLKTLMFDNFCVISEIFWILFNFGWIVLHQSTKFELSGQLCFIEHGGHGGVKVEDWNKNELIRSLWLLNEFKTTSFFDKCAIGGRYQRYLIHTFFLFHVVHIPRDVYINS